MAPPDQVGTDGEPATRGDVRRVHQRLDLMLERMEERYVPRELFVLHLDRITAEVDKHSKIFDAVQRLIIGAVILAVLALVITAK